MAESASSELTRNILRNIVPIDAAEQAGGVVDSTSAAIQSLLQSLGLGSRQQANASGPLPQKDPNTGEIIFPPGSEGTTMGAPAPDRTSFNAAIAEARRKAFLEEEAARARAKSSQGR